MSDPLEHRVTKTETATHTLLTCSCGQHQSIPKPPISEADKDQQNDGSGAK